jgi:SEC-C motif-containing protein
MTWPSSPKALLEARYKAFVTADIDFLMASHHPETRDQVDRKSIEAWAKESEWRGLTIENEDVKKDKALITFTVKYSRDFQGFNHREDAEFRKSEDRWYYFDSVFPKQETIRHESKVGRNDPCSCGSGKKFKKCCGLNS